MNDLADMRRAFDLLEGRVTLLERKLARATPQPQAAAEPPGPRPPDELHLGCHAPGLLITHVHPAEHDEAGIPFCWIGNDGPLQFVVPAPTTRPLTCTLRLRPHPSISLEAASVLANDEPRPLVVDLLEGGMAAIRFDVPASNADVLNVHLLNVGSVRPHDSGENSDMRLLAARFYGVDIVYT